MLLGLQWGDEGKGKIVDVLTPKYRVIGRFQGGPNAGHTLEFEGTKHVLHTIPSGIFRKDAINVVGNGVVIDPIIFKKEIDGLDARGVDATDRLKISKKAHLILPTHRLLDAASEKAKGKAKIRSKRRAIDNGNGTGCQQRETDHQTNGQPQMRRHDRPPNRRKPPLRNGDTQLRQDDRSRRPPHDLRGQKGKLQHHAVKRQCRPIIGTGHDQAISIKGEKQQKRVEQKRRTKPPDPQQRGTRKSQAITPPRHEMQQHDQGHGMHDQHPSHRAVIA